ncbi:hypothetical protein [Hydrotalea flava]|uniref:hypothetical protein n=1 Tax=Hydrotalea flava TaxID=714549 RepID=UPI00082CA37D|nr:hypothetical protein [Hydrotalea flava]
MFLSFFNQLFTPPIHTILPYQLPPFSHTPTYQQRCVTLLSETFIEYVSEAVLNVHLSKGMGI